MTPAFPSFRGLVMDSSMIRVMRIGSKSDMPYYLPVRATLCK